MYVDERVGDKPNETERERERERKRGSKGGKILLRSELLAEISTAER